MEAVRSAGGEGGTSTGKGWAAMLAGKPLSSESGGAASKEQGEVEEVVEEG